MPTENIIQLTDKLQVYCETDIEKWRCDSFFDKEPETIKWLSNMEEGTFYDIGANIGLYSLYAQLLNRNRLVYSFEPLWNNYKRILDNMTLNAMHLCMFHMAISNSNGWDKFYYCDNTIGTASGNLSKVQGNSEDILKITLDSFIHIFQFNHVPAYIKIDVDGYEWKVLDGMRETLGSRDLKSVLFENNYIDRKKELIGIFRNYGFTDDNEYNHMSNHSRYRREKEVANTADNIIFTRY